MELIWNGIGVGIILSILVGPILFALIQTGIERGVRAGAMVGLGIWTSDVLFILCAYWGISYVIAAIEWPSFDITLGILGGLVLITIGVSTMWSKAPGFNNPITKKNKLASYPSLWLKGFLINTINPFTLTFWAGIMSTTVMKGELSSHQTSLFIGSILGTIILTDVLKVFLAKKIRPYLKPNFIRNLRRISGAALVLFGLAMMIRVMVG